MLKNILLLPILGFLSFGAQADTNYLIRYNVNGLVDFNSIAEFDADGINKNTGTEFDEEGKDVNGNYQTECLPYSKSSQQGYASYAYRFHSVSNTARYAVEINWDGIDLYYLNVRYRTDYPTKSDWNNKAITTTEFDGYLYTHGSTQMEYVESSSPFNRVNYYSVCRQRIN